MRKPCAKPAACSDAMIAALVIVSLAAPLPHMLHIMGDDVGWNDLSFHHKSLSHSPHLDALALDGVQLRNHHAFKVCAPSRAAFHSGRLPWQSGYYDNSGAAVPWLDLDSNRNGVPLNFTLLPEILRKHAGYDAHAIGKWVHGWRSSSVLASIRPAANVPCSILRSSSILAMPHARTRRRTAVTAPSWATMTR